MAAEEQEHPVLPAALTSKNRDAAREVAMGSFDELQGLKDGVAKLEAEMEELRRTLRLTQTTSPGSHASSKIIAEIQRFEAIRQEMLHKLILQVTDFWRDFGDRFMELAREEQGRADVITKGETLRRMDKVLSISCNYQKHPEIWVNLEKPEERNFCLLHTPPHGLWGHYTGALSENFRERARLCVAQAGRALLDYAHSTDPEDFWLHRLYLDLLKNNSDSLFCASKEGGMIVSVCVASATFCARLQREALQQPEPGSATGADRLRTGEKLPESSSAQNNANSAQDAAREVFIDRAIASRKRMESSMSREVLDANPSLLDSQESRYLLGIEPPRLEHLRRGVGRKFFDEASIPRVVEVEWQSVLSLRKMPDSGVDLGLTLALTKEYQKAISRASAQLADLLTTAAGSRVSQAHIREAIWRECLDFASQLAQWDAFTTWVEKVVRVGWRPVDAHGQDSLTPDRECEKRLRERRDFFEKRISMYGRDWLSAADGAINLRLAASAPETTSTDNNGKTARSAESKSINAELGADSWQEIEIAFLSDERVEVCGRGSRTTYNYAELGFEDRRNEKPNRAWVVLRDMAGHGGAIPRPMPGKERAMIQKRIEEIREKLRGHFGIGSDPIPFNGSRYQASFKISCRASFET